MTTVYYYTINLPGCLPDSDQPPHEYESFEECRDAAVEECHVVAQGCEGIDVDRWVEAAEDAARLSANEALVLPDNYILSFDSEQVVRRSTIGGPTWPE